MKLRFTRTINIDDEQRRAIGHHLGLDRIATYKEAWGFIEERIELPVIDKYVKAYFAAQADMYAKLAGEDASE